jgi:hypothetical protein
MKGKDMSGSGTWEQRLRVAHGKEFGVVKVLSLWGGEFH